MSDKSVSQGIIGGGPSLGGGGAAATIAQLEAFPPCYINWVEDSNDELWSKPDAQLAFRVDFMVKGYSKLKFFKSLFSGDNGRASGKFAIYGNANVKLVEDSLPDYDSYGKVDFASIDISPYDYLVVCMDPGLDSIPQPLSQAIYTFPIATALSCSSFAGTFQHDHNTTFPAAAPACISTDIKYCLARWCALGVS